MKKISLFITALVIFSLGHVVQASTGVCADHGGVNCTASSKFSGGVVCGDGTNDSSTTYDMLIQCQNSCITPEPLNGGCSTVSDMIGKGGKAAAICQLQIDYFNSVTDIYNSCQNSLCRITNGTNATWYSSTHRCGCAVGYNYDTTTNQCLPNVATHQNLCIKQFGQMSSWDIATQKCVCTTGFFYDKDNGQCSNPVTVCPKLLSNSWYDAKNNTCACLDNLVKNAAGDQCVSLASMVVNTQPIAPAITSSPVSTSVSTTNANTTGSYNKALTEKMKGSILLQVQNHGEAWYVNPVDGKRYYLKDGDAAYQIMRSAGLGISDNDLSKIPITSSSEDLKKSKSICSTNASANALKGKILLQVNQHGEAWYVSPDKCKRIYLKDGAAAYAVMRYLGLGITNADLGGIPAVQ